MDSFDSVLGALTKSEWVPDRIKTLGEVMPRHIGRVATFEYFESDDPQNYESVRVVGTLEGVAGDTMFVSGDPFEWSRIANLKTYRREIVKK